MPSTSMNRRTKSALPRRALLACFGICAFAFLTVGARGAGDKPQPPGLRISTFACDVTPPAGHPLCGGWIKPLSGVDDPELAKGIIIDERFVLCVVDWCELRGDAYDLFRRKIAGALGISPSAVAVHCIHAHNAPI